MPLSYIIFYSVIKIWVLFLAGAFVAIGVYSYGENVIRTVGENLAQIDYNKYAYFSFAMCRI